MRVYGVRNPDGLTESMVAAATLAEAASALGTSVRGMRELGWSRVKGAGAAPAVKAEGRPVHRSIAGRARGTWSEDRSTVLAQAARTALRKG